VNVLLGELLLERKLITPEQLSIALADQKLSKEPLGQILVRSGFVKEADLREALSEQLGVSFLSGAQLTPRADQCLKECVSGEFARKHLVLPLEKKSQVLKVALAKVPDIIFIDNLRKITKHDIMIALSPESELRRAIYDYYSTTDLQDPGLSSETEAGKRGRAKGKASAKTDLESTIADAEKASVIQFVDFLIKKALDERASDIHLEPFENRLNIRYRVDGVLYELQPPPREIRNALVSRIKILSKMNIAENRIPQEGSFSLDYQGRKVSLRVSTIPILSGEKIVLRVMDKRLDLLNLRALGFEPEQRVLFEKALTRSYGLILVAGPAGSGKSTTLYAALNKCLSPDINIVTIEDPVEYEIPGISQVQVKPEVGLTFAAGLRAFLRQDPDVILVGEIGDLETAETCMRAALTGHLVLSTVHTPDVVNAVTRLIDIGIEPYLVAGGVVLFVAQRLVRLLCPHCKEAYAPEIKDLEKYHLKASTLYKAKGCGKCRGTGYGGRTALYEVLPVDEEFRRLITKDTDLGKLRRFQKEKGFETLLQSGIRKVEQGLTTLEEVLNLACE